MGEVVSKGTFPERQISPREGLRRRVHDVQGTFLRRSDSVRKFSALPLFREVGRHLGQNHPENEPDRQDRSLASADAFLPGTREHGRIRRVRRALHLIPVPCRGRVAGKRTASGWPCVVGSSNEAPEKQASDIRTPKPYRDASTAIHVSEIKSAVSFDLRYSVALVQAL